MAPVPLIKVVAPMVGTFYRASSPDNPPFVEVEFAQSSSGTGLEIRPSSGSAIQLLPSFSGFGSLLSGGVALLPRVLDEVDDAIAAGSVKTAVLNVADAIGI